MPGLRAGGSAASAPKPARGPSKPPQGIPPRAPGRKAALTASAAETPRASVSPGRAGGPAGCRVALTEPCGGHSPARPEKGGRVSPRPAPTSAAGGRHPAAPEVLKYPAGSPGEVRSFAQSRPALRSFRDPSEPGRPRGSGPGGAGTERRRQSRPAARPLAPRGVTVAAGGPRIRQVGGTCGPARGGVSRRRRRRPGRSVWAARAPEVAPRGPGPQLVKSAAARPGPPPRRHSPKKPCTIPSGWLSQSSPHGISPGGVPRRGASSGARPLLARALPRRATRVARASGDRGSGGGSPGAAGHGRAARSGPQPPLRTMAGNRRHRPRYCRPGWSSRGRDGGLALRGRAHEEAGRPAGPGAGRAATRRPRAAILETGGGTDRRASRTLWRGAWRPGPVG